MFLFLIKSNLSRTKANLLKFLLVIFRKQERVEMKKPFEDSPPIDLVSKPENETVSDNIGTPEVPTCAVRPLARGFSQSPKSSGNSPQSSKEMEIPFQGRIPNFQGPGVPGKFYSGLHPRPNNQGNKQGNKFFRM